MTKKELRAKYRELRKNLSAKDVAIKTDLVLINFQKLDLPFLDIIHTYIASEKLGEIDSLPIIRFLQFRNPGIKILVPKINETTRELDHIVLNEEDVLAENIYGIYEHKTGELETIHNLDMVLVPLLAFDENGHRVGYGKGFYDKFLSKIDRRVLKTGLSFFEAEQSIDDINPFDIPLDYCITPGHIYEF